MTILLHIKKSFHIITHINWITLELQNNNYNNNNINNSLVLTIVNIVIDNFFKTINSCKLFRVNSRALNIEKKNNDTEIILQLVRIFERKKKQALIRTFCNNRFRSFNFNNNTRVRNKINFHIMCTGRYVKIIGTYA